MKKFGSKNNTVLYRTVTSCCSASLQKAVALHAKQVALEIIVRLEKTINKFLKAIFGMDSTYTVSASFSSSFSISRERCIIEEGEVRCLCVSFCIIHEHKDLLDGFRSDLHTTYTDSSRLYPMLFCHLPCSIYYIYEWNSHLILREDQIQTCPYSANRSDTDTKSRSYVHICLTQKIQ